jgi:hypothetical protein
MNAASPGTVSFILLPEGYGLRTLTERLCRDVGFIPRVAFEGGEIETLRALVAAGPEDDAERGGDRPGRRLERPGPQEPGREQSWPLRGLERLCTRLPI